MMSSFCWQTPTLCICRRKVFSFLSLSLYLSTVLSFMRKVNFTTANKPSSAFLMLMLLPLHSAAVLNKCPSPDWLFLLFFPTDYLLHLLKVFFLYLSALPRQPKPLYHPPLCEGPQGAFTCDQIASVTVHSISDNDCSSLCEYQWPEPEPEKYTVVPTNLI